VTRKNSCTQTGRIQSSAHVEQTQDFLLLS